MEGWAKYTVHVQQLLIRQKLSSFCVLGLHVSQIVDTLYTHVLVMPRVPFCPAAVVPLDCPRTSSVPTRHWAVVCCIGAINVPRIIH